MKKCFLLFFIVLSLAFAGASAQAATSWYLPEGSTDNFDLWILVTNPNSTDASITFTFYRSGLSVVTATATVEANNRYSLNVNSVAGIGSSAISTKVECTNGLQIYAERAMYWDTATFTTWAGGHTARGIAADEGCYYDLTSGLVSTGLTISRPGTYVLTEDLEFSTQDTAAITISSDDVTIDLNGFTLTGPGQAVGTSGDGIYADNVKNITVKNGVVRDFRGDGIDLLGVTACQSTNVLNVTAYNNGGFGIICGIGGTISGCTADNNAGGGLNFYQGGVVRDNTCYNNTHYGIFVNTNNLVTNNSVFYTLAAAGETDSAGIRMRYSNSIVDNLVGASQYGTVVIYGIYTDQDFNLIKGNNIADCGYQDILLASGAIENYVLDNHMAGSDTNASLVITEAGGDNFYANNIFDRTISAAGGNWTGSTRTLANVNSNNGNAE